MLHRLFLALLAGILLLPEISESTSQMEFNTLQIVERSESIVLGTCVNALFDQRAGALLSNTGTFIFDVEEVVKGSPPLTDKQLTLRLGAMTRKRSPFTVRTRYILFLGKPNAEGNVTLFGMERASLQVGALASNLPHPTLGTGAARVKGPVSGMSALGLGDHPSVSDFVAAVTSYLAERGEANENR